jgi:16S rRNA (cytosine967-C5)-methyltransferase
MSDNARHCTVKALCKFFKTNCFSETLLSEMIRSASLSLVDKSFASALFYGVIERKNTLDFIIKTYSKLPLSKLDTEVQNILRAGLYQLLYMDTVPDSAAVDESVKLCKALSKTSASGFVNAVLRHFLRDGKRIIIDPAIDRFTALSIEYSVNPEIIRSLIADYGEDIALRFLSDSLLQPINYIRLNSKYYNASDLPPEQFSKTVLKNFFTANVSIAELVNTAAYRDGMYHIQDLSCGFACNALDVGAHDNVLDLCAAPGGKSFTLAEQTDGLVLSNDVSDKRIKLVSTGIKRLRLDNIITSVNDGKTYSPDKKQLPNGLFDKILCDVPCSGLGVIRKKPEIRYKDPTDFERLPQIQFDILSNAGSLLKSGGELVYSTCTLRRAENEAVVEKFLESRPDFEAVPFLTEYGAPFDGRPTTLLPEHFASDGFFIAKLRKG